MRKKFYVLLALIAVVQFGFGQEASYQLSSHILDITTGKPATGVKITLSKKDANDNWKLIDQKNTDNNGRIKDFLRQDGTNHKGIYKLTFHTAPYFKDMEQKSFYPFIEVIFELNDNEHYHVPITLSAFGYATYRGS